MNKAQVTAFAKTLGLQGIDATKRAGWVIAKCPFARWRHEKGTDSDPSFGIKIGKTFGTCFACDMHGDLDTLLYRLSAYAIKSDEGQLRIKQARAYLETDGKTKLFIGKQDPDEDEGDNNAVIEEFPEWFIDGYPRTYTHPYLEGRKGGPVPYEIAKRFDLRLDWKRHRLGPPIRDFDGRLMGFHGRSVNNHPMPYMAYPHSGHWNMPVWSGENRLDLKHPVVFVESIFDEMRVAQVYPNVCCPLSASLNQIKIARMSGVMKGVELFDQDKAGRNAATKLVSQLSDSTIKRAVLPEGFNDPGMTPAAILYDVLKHFVDVHQPIV